MQHSLSFRFDALKIKSLNKKLHLIDKIWLIFGLVYFPFSRI
jgi:hypothetical protein